MENADERLLEFAQLAAEGCRRYGDDPKAIASFIEAELRKRPSDVRDRLQEQFTLWTEADHH